MRKNASMQTKTHFGSYKIVLVYDAYLLICLLFLVLLYEDFYLVIHQMLKKKLKVIANNIINRITYAFLVIGDFRD